MVHRTLRAALGAALLVAVAASAGSANAAVESCSYDPVTKRITAEITSGSQATLKVKSSGELWFGLTPAACGGATTTNTDLIVVNSTAGTTEKLTVDMVEGFIGPGFSSESNLPEIEFQVNTGDAADSFAVIGTNNGDRMAAGASGFGFNSDGDLDVVFTPLVSSMTIVGGSGVNFLTARGGWGAGLAYQGSTTITGGNAGDELNGGQGPDAITAGTGNDVVNGYGGNDTLMGAAGNDRLSGGDGNDTITGGAGADDLIAGAGDDTMFANDGEADVQIHGAAGVDTATVDANLDPGTIAVENKIVDSGPPPPPPPPGGACAYNAATKSVTAAIPAGGTSRLAVVAGAIHFGSTPTACGAATTTNTDSITVNGQAGSIEVLMIDTQAGALAPGVGAESNGIAEIEMAVNLGDSDDKFFWIGTASAANVLAVGTKGLSFNNDTDVDVTFSPVPFTVHLDGGNSDDLLTARGGYGSGQVHFGNVFLSGHGGLDTLTGSNLRDLIFGGNDNDVITGYGGDDDIWGDAGNDQINGNDGNDLMEGGSGADSLIGGGGNDTLRAVDGVADAQLSGGAGVDTAYFDVGVDPGPSAVEIQNP